MTATPRAEWLTVGQVCADLQVSETEWNAWREAGATPLHIVMPNGQFRVRAADVERWLDSRADNTPTGQVSPRMRYGDDPATTLGLLRPLPAYRRQCIRDAIDAAGDYGLSRTDIWALTSRGYSARQLNHALAELLASEAYERVTACTGNGRPPVRYRRRKPSHVAPLNASRNAVAERDGKR